MSSEFLPVAKILHIYEIVRRLRRRRNFRVSSLDSYISRLITAAYAGLSSVAGNVHSPVVGGG
jgi:hypothetical protein